MDKTFIKAYCLTSVNEGGYANNSLDKGRETFRGISRRFHPDWEGWKLIDEAKERHNNLRSEKDFKEFINEIESCPRLSGMTKGFYYINYFLNAGLQLIKDEETACLLYDIGVNSGIKHAGKLLQSALYFLGSDIKIDGDIGSITSGEYQKAKVKDKRVIVDLIRSLQKAFYVKITLNDPSQKAFARGWYARVK